MTSQQSTGFSSRYIEWVLRNAWLVIFLCVASAGLFASGARHLGFSSNYRVFFGDDNPDLQAFDALENTYTKADSAFFVIRPNDGDVFSERTLRAVRELTARAWKIPYSTRIDSITNYQHTWAKGDELIVEDLVGKGEISEEIAARAQQVASSEPVIYGRLLSEDKKTTGIAARIELPDDAEGEVKESATFSRELLEEFRGKYPEIEFRLAGVSMLNNAFAETPEVDSPRVLPLMFLVFILAMLFFLRSALGTIVTLILVSFSAAAAIGILGFSGFKLDPTSASAPTIILTLGIADSIHILVTFFQAFRISKDKNAAIKEAFRVNAQPVFLTSITTAVSFLTLNFSDSPPFHILGNVTAIGVCFAWLYSMTFLPAALRILPLRCPKERSISQDLITRLGEFIIAHYKTVAISTLALVILLISAIGKLVINDRFHEYFSEEVAFRRAADFMIENLTGMYGVLYSLESGESNGVSSPEYLEKLSDFTNWLRSQPEVSYVQSFSDVMKRLNKNMHADDPAFYTIPESRELASQYLLLYEMSLPYGLDINDQVNVDKSASRLIVTYRDLDTLELIEASQRSNNWLEENGTTAMKGSKAASPSIMFSNITERNIKAMLLGSSLGFLLISIILMLALGSLKMGILSLIPNIVPALMAFGIWALWKEEVGFAVSVVAGLSLGIIVDDTVHFLSKYQRARKELGHNAVEAVRFSFKTVGAALLGTSVIIAAGFAMLGLSTFRVTAYMGMLTSIAIVCALITDFFLLPSLLIWFDRDKKVAA